MNSRTITGIWAALLAIGAVRFMAAHRSNREAQDTARRIDEQAIVLEGEISRARERLKTIEHMRGDTLAALDEARRAESGVLAPKVGAKAPSRPPVTAQEALRDNPRLQTLMLRSQRSQLAQRYGLFYQNLNLTSGQIEQFADNLMRQREQAMDISNLAQSRDVADGKALAALQKKATDEYLAAQKELLGESGVQQLLEYERKTQARDIVGTLAGVGALANLPLSPSQAEQLTALLANSSEAYRNGGKVDLAKADWESIDREARSILSEPQSTLFKSVDPVGGGSRWLVRFNAALTAAYHAAVPESERNPPGP